jgi:hypothetical protein
MLKIKINDEKVGPIPMKGQGEKRPVKGADLFSEPYGNIFLCARKQSGKTSVIYKIIQKCASRDTKILAFVATLNKDSSWQMIKELCISRGIYFEGYTSLKEDGIDQLDLFVKSEENATDATAPDKAKQKLLFDEEEEEAPKQRKSKYLSPEYIIILDDLSSELKSQSLVALLKKNRHLKAKIIVSSQYLNDLLPEARRQIDYHLIFAGMNKQKLETIYKDADIGVPFDKFEEIYKEATKEKYSFLYIDTRTDSFRKGFNYAIEVKD